jgi:D-alanyl-D-alanine carboxypeptidase/D-alanyl-D-alanine-endopeptidase (penicillin-binding protein 4)
MKRSIAAVLLAFSAAAPCPALASSPGAVKRTVERALARPAFANAFWGVEIRNLDTGRTLYARNASSNFKPASTLKLLTTAAALDALGPDDRFRTTVETGGRLDGLGRILGDVYLVGRGDPNLSGRFTEGRRTAAFENLADALVASGVRRIEGRLVGHEGYFRGERRGDDWAWDDLVWWYGAEVSALSFNDNCVDMTATAGERVGDPLLVDAQPRSSYYRVVSTATTSAAGTESDLTLTREPGSSVITLSGTHPMGGKPWDGSVALEDPARYAATVFAGVLERKGILVSGGIATSSEPLPETRVLAGHEGPPLSEVLKEINKPSQNLHTEMLLRTLGARVKGEGSVAKGHEALQEFLGRVGVTPTAGALQDASGLSRSDLFVPHEIVSLLVAMDRHPHARVFRDSLPVAGVDGTLKNRMKGTPAERRVQAKTGTLRHVNALAGYLTTVKGERLVFSFVINHHTAPGREATGAIDGILASLVTQ